MIFEQFSMHYGAVRMGSHWAGLKVEKTKEYWARKLARLTRQQLGFALQNMPNNPPTVDEFLAVARRAPPPQLKALGHKLSPEEVARNRERLAEIAARFGRKARKVEAA